MALYVVLSVLETYFLTLLIEIFSAYMRYPSKNIMKLQIITLVALLCAGLSAVGQGVVSTNGKLQVNGSQIQNKNGTPYSVAGNSLFWSGFESVGGKFYTKAVVDHLAQNWNAGVVRAAMAVEEADGDGGISPTSPQFPEARVINASGSGYYNNPAKELAKIKTIIDAAIANDIYVIVDYHTHFAHFYKDEAITFFTEIANTYGNNDHIIYEIFNEPIGTAKNRANGSDRDAFTQFDQTWREIIKPYAIDVIKAIRAIDPDNMIVVGTPGFSQGVEAASNNQITPSDLGFSNGTNLNIAYTLHFYAGQVEHQALRSSATAAMDNGIALFVTEWGTVEASGDGAVDEAETLKWMNFLKANTISHANWSISDKFEGASVIEGNQSVAGLLDDKLTSSGEMVQCIIANWDSNAFGNCKAGEVEETGTEDSALVPNGVGVKVEVEKPTQLDANTKSRIDYVSPGLSTGTFDTEGILTGFTQGEAVVVHTNGFTPVGSYTVQVVVSSTSANNQILFLRDSGTTNLGTVPIPNTGGLDNYQIVSISGIPYDQNAQDITIAIIGDDVVNVESFYLALDSNPNLSVSGFDADLAKLIKVFPNPVVNTITIDTKEKVSYRIFDSNGKTLIAKTAYTDQVDITSLRSGLYFIQLYVNNQTQAYRFIKK